jgi:hypothetical protein
LAKNTFLCIPQSAALPPDEFVQFAVGTMRALVVQLVVVTAFAVGKVAMPPGRRKRSRSVARIAIFL